MIFSYFPYAPASIAILFLTSAISLVAIRNENFRDRLLLNPYDTRIDKSYWRWITCGFVHAGPVHLFLNMLTLWFFGPLLEFELGTAWFLVVYGLGMLAGSLGTQFRYERNSGYPGTLGASGAISAVVLGVVVIRPGLGLSIPGLTLIHPSLSLPAWIMALLFLVVTVFFMIRSKGESKMNHDAHFWGAVAGFVIALLLQPEPMQAFMATLQP